MPRADYAARISSEADAYVSVFLHGREVGQPTTLEQKSFIENIVATDYDGRAVIELLQNAHDAHPKGSTGGRVLFRLDCTRGEYGSLIVANGGRPFGEANLQSICRVALSSKTADEGIGNKGVGFKSVLQLTMSPEIYSTQVEGGEQFDGFCFRFARSSDFEDIASRHCPDEAGFADALRANVSGLKLPVPITQIPEDLADLPGRGFVTAVVLGFSSQAAREAAQSMLAEIESAEAPVHLFLDRVACVEVETIAEDGESTSTVLERESSPLLSGGGFEAARVVLNGSDEFVLLTRRVTEDKVRHAIEASRGASRVGVAFDDWKGSAEVSIAVTADGMPLDGRLYTFLPMAESAPVPIPAYVNAPFFAHLNRKDLSTTVPFNGLLMDELADLAVEVALAASQGEFVLDPNAVIDLISWTNKELPRVRTALAQRGLELESVRVLPAAFSSDPTFSSIDSIWIWDPEGVTAIGPELVSKRLGECFLSPTVTSERQSQIEQIADSLGCALYPGSDEIAAWASQLAGTVVASGGARAGSFDDVFWAALYDDLSVLVPRPTKEFRERPLILDDSGELQLAPGQGERTSIFFHPLASDVESLDVGLPKLLQGRIRFTHRRLPRLTGPSKRPGRTWLEGFVNEFNSAEVLRVVGEAMRESDDDAARSELLGFSFDLWYNSREKPSQALRSAQLPLPARGGWVAATKACFSAGWGEGDDLQTSTLYERFAEEVAEQVAPLKSLANDLLQSPTSSLWPEPMRNEPGYEFLVAAGVSLGLQPELMSQERLDIYGHVLNDPTWYSGIGGGALTAAESAIWAGAAISLKSGCVQYKQPYKADQPMWRLPAQRHYEQFTPRLREMYAELILRGLPSWLEATLFIRFQRSSDTMTIRWPSLVLAFLQQTAWLPQRVPGGLGEVSFALPAKAWWTRSGEVPTFLSSQPRRLVALNHARTLARLSLLGVRFWDAPESALDRLTTVLEIIRTRRPRGRELQELRNAFEQAWSDALDRRLPVPADSGVVVRRGGDLELVDPPSSETVYVADRAGATAAQLLAQVRVPMLATRDPNVADGIYEHLLGAGTFSVRRASEAQIEVRVDSVAPKDVSSLRAATEWPWMVDLVLALVQTDSVSTHIAGDEALKRVQLRLSKLRVAAAQTLVTYIEGHQVVESGRPLRSLLVEDDGGPLVIVHRPRSDSSYSLLEDAAPAIMEAVGFAELSDSLAMALVRLGRHEGEGTPDALDLAGALNLDPRELAWASDPSTPHGGWEDTIMVILVALLDLDLVDEFREASASFIGDESVAAWLGEHEARLGVAPEQLLAMALEGDVRSAAQSLGVVLSRVNVALRVLGLPQMHNVAGHRQRYDSFRSVHLAALVDRLRTAFIDQVDDPVELAQYVALRKELELVEPDPLWLDEYWDLPESVCREWFDRWFEERELVGASADAVAPLSEVLDSNRRVVAGVMSAAQATVEAWAFKNGEVTPQLPEAGSVQRALQESGRLDFARITTAVVIDYLASVEAWPPKMQRTLTLNELGLTQEEVERARERSRLARSESRRKLDAISYAGRSFVGDEDDRHELAEWVLSQLPATLLATPVAEAPLALYEKSPATRKGPGGGGASERRMSEQKANSVGYVGELIAARWIEEQYGVPPVVSWCSRNREHYTGTPGDDGLGYDFRVVTESEVLLFEVKATTGHELQFEMGETEVRCAQALEEGERYVILFISNVTEPSLTRLQPLPNPFGRNGLTRYGLLGHKLRLGFHAQDPMAESE